MRPTGLIDTGALFAIVNPRDQWHAPCMEILRSALFPLATTASALTELFHLLPSNPWGVGAGWRFLDPDIVTVLPIGDEDMPRIKELMVQYADRPMDFADATLVRLAERESLTTIFTVDHDDFETYRINGRRRFRIVPERRDG